jgi:hypothetical protein
MTIERMAGGHPSGCQLFKGPDKTVCRGAHWTPCLGGAARACSGVRHEASATKRLTPAVGARQRGRLANISQRHRSCEFSACAPRERARDHHNATAVPSSRSVGRMCFHVLAAPDCCLSPQAKSASRINTMIRDGFPTNNEYPFATLAGLEPSVVSPRICGSKGHGTKARAEE